MHALCSRMNVSMYIFCRYRSYKSQNWKMTELNNSIHEVKIGDLISGETYDVMVLSQNDVGDGIFSKTMRVTTKSKYYFLNNKYYLISKIKTMLHLL